MLRQVCESTWGLTEGSMPTLLKGFVVPHVPCSLPFTSLYYLKDPLWGYYIRGGFEKIKYCGAQVFSLVYDGLHVP